MGPDRRGMRKGYSARGFEGAPMEFPRANRRIGAGKHPLTKVFPGLDEDPAFVALFPDGAHEEVLAKCYIEAVPEDMYMYIDDSDGHIVAGLDYLKTGEPWVLYLDVIHELTHIRQWRAGEHPWGRRGPLGGPAPRGGGGLSSRGR